MKFKEGDKVLVKNDKSGGFLKNGEIGVIINYDGYSWCLKGINGEQAGNKYYREDDLELYEEGPKVAVKNNNGDKGWGFE